MKTQRQWTLFITLACLALLVVACGKKEAPASPENAAEKTAPVQEPAKEEKADSKVLTLSEAAVKNAQLTYVEVKEDRISAPFAATGQVALNEDRTVRVGSLFTGRILDVLVKVGDRVKQGQSLARMHTHEVHEASAEYAKSRAELEQRKQAAAHANSLLERAERLFAARALARNELDRAKLDAASAKQDIARAQAELERAIGHFEHLGLPEPGDGPINYDAPVIVKAPANGVIIKREITPGASVNPGENLFFLSDLSSVWVLANVPEQHLAALRVGSTVNVAVAAYPDQSFSGRIQRIGDMLNPETRTVEVRCVVENRAAKLKPEMFATINLPLGQSRNALLLDEAALQVMNGENVVFVARDNLNFEKRTIKIGQRQSGMVEVLDGLKAGERVVTKGSFLLKSEFSKDQLADEE